MAKSNNKQNRTNGTTPSSNMELPNPLTSFNSPLSGLNNKDSSTIIKENGQNARS